MPFISRVLFAAGLCLTFAAAAAHAQSSGGAPVTAEIIAHLYKPVSEQPTEQHLKQLQLPNGFMIEKFTTGLGEVRMLAVAQNGTVYVTRPSRGDVVMLRDTNGDGMANEKKTVVKKPQVHGIAIHDDKMYLATIHAIYVADMRKDGTLGKLQTLVDDLPNGGQHANRTLGFGPDGMLYVSVGSLCDTCSETDPKNATILQVDPNSGQETIFASGLRNTLGFAWHPKTKEMWGMDLGIDFLGDNKPGEELNHLVKGAMYGWPYAYGNRQPNTEIKASSGESIAKMVKQSKPAALLYTAHAAPMQMAFYTGSQFPAAYRDDAFVAMHGSWNRRPPSGYEIVRIKFNDAGQPQAFAPFVTGFLTRQKGGTYAEFGRPTGLAIAKDGSLLVGDDTHGVIYRISYQGNSQ